MNFGKIDQFMIFGAGQLLVDVVLMLKKSGRKVHVATSERNVSDNLMIDRKPLKTFLYENDIDFIVSEDVNKDPRIVQCIDSSTLGISVGAPWIFKDELINRFSGKLINSHGARLPQNRGGGGFSWRILRDDRLGYSVIHQLNTGLDTGAIVSYSEYYFPHSCRVPVDYEKYSHEKNMQLFKEFISGIESGIDFSPIGQPEYLSSYWPRLSTEIHGYIDWSWDLKDIERFICAFDDPYIGATTYINNNKVRLKACMSGTSDGYFHPFQRGIIYRISNGTFFIATPGGSLIVNDVRDEFENDFRDKLRVGDRFYTPSELIDDALKSRVVYTPKGGAGNERRY